MGAREVGGDLGDGSVLRVRQREGQACSDARVESRVDLDRRCTLLEAPTAAPGEQDLVDEQLVEREAPPGLLREEGNEP